MPREFSRAVIHIRKKYVYRSVAHYFPKSMQNPILYVNVD